MTYEDLKKEDDSAIFARIDFQKVTEDAHLPEYSRAGDAAENLTGNGQNVFTHKYVKG